MQCLVEAFRSKDDFLLRLVTVDEPWIHYELIPHPAYSPDLAPSDFFLFPNLKKDIRGCHFRSDEEVMAVIEELVSGKDPGPNTVGLGTSH